MWHREGVKPHLQVCQQDSGQVAAPLCTLSSSVGPVCSVLPSRGAAKREGQSQALAPGAHWAEGFTPVTGST